MFLFLITANSCHPVMTHKFNRKCVIFAVNYGTPIVCENGNDFVMLKAISFKLIKSANVFLYADYLSTSHQDPSERARVVIGSDSS